MKKPRAFTLIELLVVVAIIAVLLALILPAVQKVRESANRMRCANNLKQLGVAMHAYHGNLKSFPAGIVGVPADDLQFGKTTGFCLLLPYIEQDNVERQWDPTKFWYDPVNFPAAQTQIKLFYCPSNRPNGIIDNSALPIGPLPNPAACDYILCKGSNAALAGRPYYPAQARGVFEINVTARIADIRDGTSSTFAIGEGAGNNPLYLGRDTYAATTPLGNSFKGGAPTQLDQAWSVGSTNNTFFHNAGWLSGAALGVTAERGGFSPVMDERMNNRLVLAAVDRNGGLDNSNVSRLDTLSGFRSLHPGGCNFLFCDGHVQFVRQTVSANTYRALSTMAGEEVIAEDY